MHESFPDAECQDAGDKTGDMRMVTSHVRQHLPFRGQACKSVGHYGEEHAAFQTGSPCIVLDKNESWTYIEWQGFFFVVFGLLVCVLWWAFLKSYESLTLPVAHPTCLLSSFLHALLFLSLISPPRLPCWVLCGLTQLTCDIPLAATVGPGNGMNSTLASQDWWENVFPVNGMRISLCYWTQTKKLSPAASCDLECREQHTNMDRSCTLDGLWRHWPHSTWSLATSGLMNTHLWFSRQLESGFCSLWPNHFKYTKGLIYLFSKN